MKISKRREYFLVVFVIGVVSGILAALLREFRIGGIGSPLLGLAWFACMLLYTEFLTIPRTFSQDADPRWHLNPWQEALQRLGEDGRQVQGIILLVAYPLCRGIFAFFVFGSGLR